LLQSPAPTAPPVTDSAPATLPQRR
jgi:hypothetical protein